jgi:hypothetical protein
MLGGVTTITQLASQYASTAMLTPKLVWSNHMWVMKTPGGIQNGAKLGMLSVLQNPIVKGALGVVGAVVNGYTLYKSASTFWKKPTVMGAVGIVGSAIGVAVGVNSLLFSTGIIVPGVVTAAASAASSAALAAGATAAEASAAGASAASGTSVGMIASFIPLWGWAVAIGIALAPLIAGLFQSSESKALDKLTKDTAQVIWTAGPLLFVGVGTTALLMGWPKPNNVPIMSGITVQQSFVTRALGQPIPLGTSKAPTILVEHGNGIDPGHVIVVSPQGVDEHGKALLRLNAYTLTKELDFVSSEKEPEQCYIPFFVYQGGKAIPNPQIVQSLTSQDALLKSALSGGLSAQDAMSALELASASNKSCISTN